MNNNYYSKISPLCPHSVLMCSVSILEERRLFPYALLLEDLEDLWTIWSCCLYVFYEYYYHISSYSL